MFDLKFKISISFFLACLTNMAWNLWHVPAKDYEGLD